MARDSTRKLQTKKVSHSNPKLEDQIRRPAYKLYEARGREESDKIEGWLRAEAEIAQL